MSEEYEGTSNGGDDGVQRLEEALNRAANKYFVKNPQPEGADPILFDVVKLQVYASHNPIHGYRVVLTPAG